MAEPLGLLVIDDNPGDARLVALTLAAEAPDRYRVERAGRIADALPKLDAGNVAVVLLDLGLPDSQGTDGLRRIRARAPHVAVIVLSGSEDAQLRGRAYRDGAQDCQVKGVFPPGELDRRLRAAVAAQAIEQRLARGGTVAATDLAPLAGAGEGAAVLFAPGEAVENDRFRALAGGPAAVSTPESAWLTRLLRELEGSGPAIHGWLAPDGEAGHAEPVEYLLRQVGPTPAVLLRLHRRGAGPAPSSGAPADAALDPATLSQLEELGGGDPEFVVQLLATFRREGERIIGRLTAEGEAIDLDRAARDAHTLKSAAAQVGALRLSRLALDLERCATAANATGARAVVRELEAEFDRVEADPRMARPRAGR
jgi:CheY-like chemotaxis protein/HPt (histidine-containing phosphotransfer) domain-containing protein